MYINCRCYQEVELLTLLTLYWEVIALYFFNYIPRKDTPLLLYFLSLYPKSTLPFIWDKVSLYFVLRSLVSLLDMNVFYLFFHKFLLIRSWYMILTHQILNYNSFSSNPNMVFVYQISTWVIFHLLDLDLQYLTH